MRRAGRAPGGVPSRLTSGPLGHRASRLVFFFNDTATPEIYTPLYTLSLHDALPISALIVTRGAVSWPAAWSNAVCASCRSRSEEHTSELQSHSGISYAVFCLKK